MLLILSGSMVKSFVTVNFLIYQDQIAKEKCENKDKPQMNCNGKCYLAKQLKAAEEKQKENAPISPEKIQVPDELFDNHQTTFSFFATPSPSITAGFAGMKSFGIFKDITPPPPEC
jgi:hypothetical protein